MLKILLSVLTASLVCVNFTAVAQTKDAEELIRALKPKPLMRGLRVEDSTKPTTDITINFEYNSARLSGDSIQQLVELAKAFNDPALARFRYKIVGHTDGVGSDVYNMELSKRRAAAVVSYLSSQQSVRPTQLLSEGKGKRELKFPAEPENAANRRVEITLVDQL
jgi:outer membrane protein OmpA-like peptidoglycan-associated protein